MVEPTSFRQRRAPFRPILHFLLGGLLLFGVIHAESPASEPDSLQAAIEALKAKNRAKAAPEKLEAYARGIEAVKTSGMVAHALNVGDQAPDFQLKNAAGKPVRLSEELSRGPVVLTWYRGGWCPYCNLQLAAYQKILPEIEALGAQLIALTPELPDKSLSTSEKLALEFHVLSDRNLKVAKAYGLVFELTPEVEKLYAQFFDIRDYNGAEAKTNELPLAATYVIDSKGEIHDAFLDADYTRRAEPAEILQALEKLRQ